jgi:beta-lactamase regulating signal transducer with metallopeptidase domain
MLAWTLQNTVLGGVMAGLVVVACRLRRVSPATRHVLWVLVLVKLMTPPLVSWPWRWPDGLLPIESTDSQLVDSQLDGGVQEEGDVAWFPEPELGLVAPPPEASAASLEPMETACVPMLGESAVHPVLPRTPSIPLLWLWMAGSLLVACIETVRIVRASRVLRRARSPSRELADLVLEVSRRIGVRPPPVLLTDRAASPFLWCLLRPRLVVPSALVDSLGDDAVRSVIAHELAHLKRRDHWVGWLELAAGIVWWWNPVYWLARREARDSAELACDAWVVWALPGSRKAFAEALIEVCQRFTEYEAPAPALGMSGGGRQAFFRRRLHMILLESVPRRVPIAKLLCIGLVGLAFLPAWTQDNEVSLTTPPAVAGAPPAPQELPAPPPQVRPAKPAPAPRLELPSQPGLAPPPAPARAAKPVPAPKPAGIDDAPEAAPEDETAGADGSPEPPFTQAAREYRRWLRYRANDSATLYGDSKGLADRVLELEKTIAQVNQSVAELRTALMSKGPFEPMAGGWQMANPNATPPRLKGSARRVQNRPGQPADERPHMAEVFRLPKAKAEALAAFLKEHVDSSLEATVSGDQLILESDAQTNAAVHQLIPLMTRAK